MLSAGLGWAAAAVGAITWGVVHGLRLRERERELDEMRIRPLAADELERVVGFAGRSSEQLQALLVAQLAGSASCLVAWLGEQPVGMASIAWDGPREAKVRESCPECPEVHSIEVEATRRSEGIGSRLLAHAEGLILARGHACAGLAVAIDNVHAYALYLRSGYAEPQRIEYELPGQHGPSGQPLRWRFLVKHFKPGPAAKDTA
jgi:GNAT superfamily N-acetyltransferase